MDRNGLIQLSGGADGSIPFAGVILDTKGALYGETVGGGAGTCFYQGINGCGVVYKLMPPTSGATWTESVLYTFTGGTDGGNPSGNLIFGESDVLYGTTLFGGTLGSGTVFELRSSAAGTWTQKVIHNFGGPGDGAIPIAGVVFDKRGDLWSTTSGGGASLFGTVFKLHRTNSGWAEAVEYSFTNGIDGAGADAAVTFDQNGNLYSTTTGGGKTGNGTVFMLSPPASPGEPWAESVLYSFFDGADGGNPEAAVFFDQKGNLYSTTHNGGEAGGGTAFRLAPPTQVGGAWTETVLYGFTNETDGGLPSSNLVPGLGGFLYGTTYVGGASFSGTVFKVLP